MEEKEGLDNLNPFKRAESAYSKECEQESAKVESETKSEENDGEKSE